MIKLLERSIHSLDTRLLLLAPPGAVIPTFFRNVEVDAARHNQFVREMQRLRGNVYLEDGAVEAHQLSAGGCHETPEDDQSWHLLTLDERQRVTGCAWYREHEATVRPHHLRVRSCPLARMKEWRDTLRAAIETEIAHARRENLRYAEVGGWAVAKEARSTSQSLVLALAGFSLGRICGGCLGITTATVRHCSSTILRRLGGAPLQAGTATVPPYYDPKYKCEMEILRFDSRAPNARYAEFVETLRRSMANVQVIALPPAPGWFSAFQQPAAHWTESLAEAVLAS
jgi:hypothetical protein